MEIGNWISKVELWRRADIKRIELMILREKCVMIGRNRDRGHGLETAGPTETWKTGSCKPWQQVKALAPNRVGFRSFFFTPPLLPLLDILDIYPINDIHQFVSLDFLSIHYDQIILLVS